MTDYLPEAVAMTDAELQAALEAEQRQAELARLRLIPVAPLKKMVDGFRDGTQNGRAYADKSRAYFEGDQLDGPKLTALKRARQPRVIRNEITPAVNGLLGIIQQGKVDPKAWPRNPSNEDQSDVASKTLRYVSDATRLHQIKVDAAENHLVEGVCGVMVEADEKGDATIARVPYDEAIYDPHSQDADFSDARYLGLGKWLYESTLTSMYPDFADEFGAAFSGGWGASMGLDRPDKPENAIGSYWTDAKTRRLFVVELYHLEDVWMRSVFVEGMVLEQAPSPYLDDDGQPMCAAVFGSCYIDKDNQRYGIVKSMLSPQDELNAYASRALHLANSRQIQVSDAVVMGGFVPEVDSKTASDEAAKANGVIPPGYNIVPTNDLLQSILVMMQDAKQAIIRQAPTPAVLADASAGNQSGRSRLVLQQAGMTEIARALGRLENWENEIYRHVWLVLKQFKTEPWFVRITGDDGKPGFEALNKPEMDNTTGQMKITNRLATMDVDIEVETIPDTANLQAEQFEALAPLLPQVAEAFGVKKALEVGLALSSVPDKAKIKEMLEAPEDESPEQQAMAQQQNQMKQQIEQMALQMQMQAAQLANLKTQGEIQKIESDTALNRAKIEQIDADVTMDAIRTHKDLAMTQTPEMVDPYAG